jgi:hypothetical protein
MKKLTPVLLRSRVLLGIAILATATLFLSTLSRAQNINEVVRSGPYTFNLKVLPPETFHGAHAEMMHDSGAPGMAVHGAEHPNHHLVVFIKKGGKPVEDAQVTMAYRKSGRKQWKELPVARMHVAGKGPETTHYGNNVYLAPGKYEVRVTVAGATPATFHITLDK